ncbi:MAG: sigma-54-dependent Fis family transcriptional regulator [Pseudomonadota bacterium]
MSGNQSGGRVEAALQLSGIAQNRAVLESWQRCEERFGLAHDMTRRPEVMPESQTRQRRDRSGRLYHHAHDLVRTLYRKIDAAGYAVFLTDHDGVILDSVAAHSLLPSFRTNGLLPGAVWSEEREGTNGIGTCIIEGRPITIHKDEHFLSSHAVLTCTAAPVFDPDGQVCSVLDVSAVRDDIKRNDCLRVRGLVADYATALERILFFEECAADLIVHLHPDAGYVGSTRDALIAVAPDGTIRGATSTARRLLSATGSGFDIRTAFGLDVGDLVDRLAADGQGQNGPRALSVAGGGVLFGQMTLPEKQRRTFVATPRPVATPSMRKNADIPDQDPVIRRLFGIGCKLLGSGINILMSGETGSGKEYMARIIHDQVVGARKPFVAINCAALPENLIESELFGHVAGAFTGAAKDGFGGRIRQAEGGTLFLDEIGDMPLSAQSRLLRVLEQRCVEPLGSTKSVKVNFRLICASNVDLTRAVAEGRFREDLLYRIKGARLALPPLRDRNDLHDLVKRLLAESNGGTGLGCDDAVMTVLARYNWPGNVRELVNVLQYAAVFAENGVISPDHLPDDFWPEDKIAANDGNSALQQAEAQTLRRVLADHRWHVTNAARSLGLSRNTLYRKMDRFGIRRGGQGQGII